MPPIAVGLIAGAIIGLGAAINGFEGFVVTAACAVLGAVVVAALTGDLDLRRLRHKPQGTQPPAP